MANAELAEAITRAQMSAEKEAVVDAVAQAEGVTFNTARNRHDEVREVRTIAQERAERRGTSVEEEAPRVALQPRGWSEHRARVSSLCSNICLWGHLWGRFPQEPSKSVKKAIVAPRSDPQALYGHFRM